MPRTDRKAATIDMQADLSNFDSAEARDFLVRVLAPDPKGGVLRLFDQPYVLMRPEILTNIQKQLEQTIGGSAKGILYLAGERSSNEGLDPLVSLTEAASDPLSLDHAKRMADVAALIGWGRVEIQSFDVDRGRFLLTVQNSPFADAYGPSKKPICHFLAGWMAGMGRMLVGKDLLCEETACKSQGRERCEFELRPMPSR